jgi:hypothetical protein
MDKRMAACAEKAELEKQIVACRDHLYRLSNQTRVSTRGSYLLENVSITSQRMKTLMECLDLHARHHGC